LKFYKTALIIDLIDKNKFGKSKMKKNSEFVSELEAADMLGVSAERIIELWQTGTIPGAELRGRICFFRRDIEKMCPFTKLKAKNGLSKENSIISEVITPERIIITKNGSKEKILKVMTQLMTLSPVQCNKKIIEAGIFKRESLMSTGMGMGIAIPHVRIKEASDMAMSAALIKEGISDYGSMDNKPVFLLFMIVGHISQHDKHLKIVSALSLKLKNRDYFKKLSSAANNEEFHRILTGRQND